MEWLALVIANWETVLLIGTSAVTIASAIVKLTPTKKDDEVLSKVMGIINLIALNKKPK